LAFNLQTFKTRALTAIIFAVVMLGGLLWNRWSFLALFSLVHFGAWFEYQKLVGLFNPAYQKITAFHRYAVPLAGWCLMLYFTDDRLLIGSLSLSAIGLWTGLVLMIVIPLVILMGSRSLFFQNLAYSFFGLIYISLSLALLTDLRNRWDETLYDPSFNVPLLLIFSIWINDTMAYIVGSFIGKTPLSSISPKKTWEGTIGGVLLTIIAIALIAYFTKRLPVAHAAVMAALAAVSGTFGDLFESKLKRMAGVKDSGSFMPGHGGFLDRFDSLLLAAICVWLYAVAVF
jgi:phosphatidate cytidylyltransferase